LAGLKIIIRLTLGFASLTLRLLCCWPFGRQYDAHQPLSTMSTKVHRVHNNRKAAKARGRHIKAQGKPGRQVRRSPG